jgi:hypothetical protein
MIFHGLNSLQAYARKEINLHVSFVIIINWFGHNQWSIPLVKITTPFGHNQYCHNHPPVILKVHNHQPALIIFKSVSS